jgi:Caspase domain
MNDNTDRTLLIDRRDEIPGPGLHALIVGVSLYEGLPPPSLLPPRDSPIDPKTLGLAQVKTPATSAWKFAQWVRERYHNPDVPLKTLRLLVSSSEDELKAITGLRDVTIPERRANRHNVWEAMQSWKKDCTGDPRNVTIFYASGHGVQWGSKEDALVLLDDFSGKEMFLDHGISFSGTRQGMSGPTMPQTQLYFVDACRVRPEAAKHIIDAGRGLQFRIAWTGDDLRSAPIFFAAAPETFAQGVLEEGTFFCSALIECLESLAASAPNGAAPNMRAAHSWHVNVDSILKPLEQRVAALAEARGEKQNVVQGGQARHAIFHVLKQPPSVRVLIDVDPDEVAKLTEAELVDEHEKCIRERQPCFERPLEWQDVQAGLYILKLHRKDPVGIKQKPIQPLPPRHLEVFRFP